MKSAISVFLCALLCSAAIVSGKVEVSNARFADLEAMIRQKLVNFPQYKIDAIRQLQLQLIKFRKLQAIAEANRGCVDDRDERLKYAISALEEAYNCRFHGLPYELYVLLKPRCDMRGPYSGTVSKTKSQCDSYYGERKSGCMTNEYGPAHEKLLEIQAVCQRIGQSGGPTSCPSLEPLRLKIEELRAIDCGIGSFTYEEILRAIEEIIQKIKDLLDGQPLPSNDPRFYDTPF